MHCKYTIEVSLCLIIISLMNNKCTCGSIKRRHCKTHRENAPAFQLKNPCKCSSCRVQIILYAGSHFAPSLQSTVLFYVALHILALGYVSHITTSILFTKYIIHSAFFLFFQPSSATLLQHHGFISVAVDLIYNYLFFSDALLVIFYQHALTDHFISYTCSTVY